MGFGNKVKSLGFMFLPLVICPLSYFIFDLAQGNLASKSIGWNALDVDFIMILVGVSYYTIIRRVKNG